MSKISELLDGYSIPPVAKARQYFDSAALQDPAGELRALLQRCPAICGGQRIAITAGSRGIDAYQPLLCEIVRHIRSCGAEPFLVPAMGSHGGATAEGQLALLRALGITEQTVGAPILSSMQTVCVGRTPDGTDVHIDKYAAGADGIVLFNRVKPHTSFRGPYESGLLKMLAIGLGKQRGAESTHSRGYGQMAASIEQSGKVALGALPILCGIATVENAYGKVAGLHLLQPQEILPREPQLLAAAWRRMPTLAPDRIDVLIVGEIGKDISGTGMDTNIVGRFHTRAATGGPSVERLGVLGLSPASHGNANGMGLADFIPRRMVEQVDWESTYLNTLTSTEPASSRMPMVLDNDERVIKACIKLCGRRRPAEVRMALIRNTKYLDEVYFTQAAIDSVVRPIEVLGVPFSLPFDSDGRLQLFGGG